MTNSTSIAIVLDRSGSMHSTKNDTIGGFNAFLTEQKKQEGEAVLTLATFANDYTIVYDCMPIADVPELTDAVYIPSGGTALLDAIARTINATETKIASMKQEERPSNVLLVIITDGEENASREFNHEKVMGMIKRQQEEQSWSVVYIGANQDAIQVGTSMGIARGNTMNYAANAAGTADLYASVSSNSAAYRTMTYDYMEIGEGKTMGAVSNFFELADTGKAVIQNTEKPAAVDTTTATITKP
jgi:uncharacterized protein YegL